MGIIIYLGLIYCLSYVILSINQSIFEFFEVGELDWVKSNRALCHHKACSCDCVGHVVVVNVVDKGHIILNLDIAAVTTVSTDFSKDCRLDMFIF